MLPGMAFTPAGVAVLILGYHLATVGKQRLAPVQLKSHSVEVAVSVSLENQPTKPNQFDYAKVRLKGKTFVGASAIQSRFWKKLLFWLPASRMAQLGTFP